MTWHGHSPWSRASQVLLEQPLPQIQVNLSHGHKIPHSLGYPDDTIRAYVERLPV